MPPAVIVRLRREPHSIFTETPTVQRPYLTFREYLKSREPTVFALLLDPDKEEFTEEYKLAAKVAAEQGERGLSFPGEPLPLFKDCVWAEVYRRQR